jgi:hypothetical protein
MIINLAENDIGRLLTTDKMVHYKNGLKFDNRPENLEVMSNAENLEKINSIVINK